MSISSPAAWLKQSASAIVLVGAMITPAYAQDAAAPTELALQDIVVTGTRIKTPGLTATSPVTSLDSAALTIQRAVTVEDFSTKMPQLAGGVNSTSAGSDAFGAQTLDLRNLGQNRTLVLINGTRAVPFSFRNSVDVNFIPAPLIKRVDILTGGASAVYGADAVAGVVNFIMNDSFTGYQANANYRTGDGGGAQYGVNGTYGLNLGDRGNIVFYGEYTKRDGLLAGNREFARAKGIPVAGSGGNFTDVASGRTFSVDDAGNFTTTPQTTDYTPLFTLIQPMRRINASTFFNYELAEIAEVYGRVMYNDTRTTGAPRSGQQPAVFDGVVGINSTNPNIPAQARPLLTFVNGVAQVRVVRSLSELGVPTAKNKRETYQGQLGVRGSLTDHINWDAYGQFGQSNEDVTVFGDGLRSAFPAIVNTADIFGPGADLSAVAQPFDYGTRKRKQTVLTAYVSGDTGDFFNGWAGPIGFTAGYEYRKERGVFNYNPNLPLSFRQSAESAPVLPPKFSVNELYGELLIPVLSDLPFAENISLEGAFRRSWYERPQYKNASNTSKIGINWKSTDDIRFRATRQIVLREPNIGEWANPIFSIPFRNLVTVARLRPRYQGDPCVIAGSGANADQCRRFGAPAVGSYNSLDAANLPGGYFFGGNPQINPEKGRTYTIGGVFTPSFVPNFTISVDYYNIRIKDAVGQIQPVDALTSCYITDPSADNPLCAAVTRNPTTGRIQDGFPVDRNLAAIKQQGIDIDARYAFNLPDGMLVNKVTLDYNGSIVTKYTIQRNAVLAPIDCKGAYAFRCSSDAVSLVAPDYRHRAAATFETNAVTAQVAWKRIGEVKDSNIGISETIKAYNYFDLNLSIRPPLEGVSLNVGVNNMFNKKPPLPTNAGVFNTYPDTYDVLGRTVGVSLTFKN
jgi:iron complex outermembrane recepter protein